ncbi:hypothetical protein HQQ81_15425 [Microbacteriaceae bacterium VKM Ac-2854]|nr:hypothetical protein [Microbacteriaceae bacterium VKM Ac-2854]
MSVTAVIDTAVIDTAVIDTAVIEPIRREEPARRPHIEVVPTPEQRAARPRVVYALVAVAGLFVIVVIQLLISVGLSQGAYEITTLQSQQKNLTRANAEKQDAVDALSSPQSLAAAAQAQGMVTNSSPVYLRLSDGAVLGVPAAATGAAVAGANLVPNSLLTPATPSADAQASTDTAASDPAAAGAPVPLQGELPAPVTH